MTGSVNITKSAGVGDFTATIAHSLGYTPFCLAYFKLSHATKYWFQESLDDSALPGDFIYGFWTADDTNVYLTVRDNSGLGALTTTAYYIILIDKAYE